MPHKILLLENIHANASRIFEASGFEVHTENKALSEAELIEQLPAFDVVGIRSKTNITKKVLEVTPKLKAIGAFCIGTNQINLDVASLKGIPVFNAPFSNTRSVVELAIGEIIMLLRRIPYFSHQMHLGNWIKSAENAYEVRGKKLGIVGYGNIGAQLSVLAEAIGMEVYYFDLSEKLALGNAKKCNSLDELLSIVDIVSLHVDGRPENRKIFGEREFELMKPNSVLINLSRGFVVDIEALEKVLANGKLIGASIDVFPEEPKKNGATFASALIGKHNVILTPHIGGSTQEAQENIGNYVPAQLIDFIKTGSTFGSVNFPPLQMQALHNAHRLLHIHENMPGIMGKINSILGSYDINIIGQHLKTNEQIGYVITDINTSYSPQVLHDLKAIPYTIKLDVLY